MPSTTAFSPPPSQACVKHPVENAPMATNARFAERLRAWAWWPIYRIYERRLAR
jgi:hypothetical protein